MERLPHDPKNEFQVWRWFQAMLAARGLSAPDKRSLYKYELSTIELASLESLLLNLFHSPLPKTPRRLGAAFCLWTASWFQREFSGGAWNWAGPMTPIGAPNDPQSRELLVTVGMAYLQRPIRTANGSREFLASLVVEGGFPSRLISEHRNWLTKYVESVTLAASQGDNSLEAATEHATFYQFIVPSSFRAPSLIDLTSELAHHIANLRRRLIDNGITEGAVEWLNRVDPRWREDLPVATGDEAARMLVEGLVRASPRKPIMPVSCHRLLKVNHRGEWTFGLRMEIEGKIDDSDLPANVRARLESFNRARILPAGALEKKGLPAIGVANRTDDGDWKGWEVESLMGRGPMTINEFPIDEDARLVFAIGDRTGVEFVPLGGARVTSDILVFRQDGQVSDDALPSTFVLVGTGSIKERETRLFLAVPFDAAVNPVDDTVVAEISVFAGLKLLCVTGGVSISIGGDRYSIRSGADQPDSIRIETVGQSLEGANADRPAYLGCPAFFIHSGMLKKAGDIRSIRMRTAARNEGWQPFDSTKLPYGVVDIAAIDKNGVILDRLTMVHLPDSARIKISVPHKGICLVRVDGFDSANIEVLNVDVGRVSAEVLQHGHLFTITTTGTHNADLRLRLRWKQSEAILSVPVLADKLAFYDGDGGIIENQVMFSVLGLRGVSVKAVDKSTIVMTVCEPGDDFQPLCVERNFEKTLPFSQIRDDVQLLFSMTDNLDAKIRVEAIHGGTQWAIINVQRFDITLKPDGGGQVTLSLESMKKLQDEQAKEVRLFGRPFLDVSGKDRELDVVKDSQGIWTVEDGEGPWFVYAKVDGAARSRPLHVNRELEDGDLPNPFLSVVTTVNRVERQDLVISLLGRIGEGSDPLARDQLIAFIGSLDADLPLQAFDVLRLLPYQRTASVQMAVNANEDALRIVIDLDEKLPMSWFTTSPSSWCAILKMCHADYARKLLDAGLPREDALGIASDQVRRRIQEIARRRPCLSVHLAIAMDELRIKPDLSRPERLGQACQLVASSAHLTSVLVEQCRHEASKVRTDNDGRTWPVAAGFRGQFRNLMSEKFEAAHWTYPVLDAPFAAVAIALGEVEWTPALQRTIRACRAFDPIYFEGAFVRGLTIRWTEQSKKLAGRPEGSQDDSRSI